MSERAESIQQLILLSQNILTKAKNQDWEEVITLEQERNQLFKDFFLEPVQLADVAMVAAGIEEIMSIDRDIMDLGIMKKLDLADVLHTLDQGKKAVKAYSDNF